MTSIIPGLISCSTRKRRREKESQLQPLARTDASREEERERTNLVKLERSSRGPSEQLVDRSLKISDLGVSENVELVASEKSLTLDVEVLEEDHAVGGVVGVKLVRREVDKEGEISK